MGFGGGEGGKHPLTWASGYNFPLFWFTQLTCLSVDKQPLINKVKQVVFEEMVNSMFINSHFYNEIKGSGV